MDRNQVRARIIEVAQTVKARLTERGMSAEEKKESYRCIDGVAQPRPSAFWSEDHGFKYIDDVEEHLRRLFQCLDLLNPEEGSSVFEIGPGNCYFLFMCRELRGCRVAGVEWIQDVASRDKKSKKMPFHELKMAAYQLFREQFGVEAVIKHQVVEAYQPVAFGGPFDAIVATRAMFNCHWKEGEYRFWLEDCYQHLRPQGRLMVHFNQIDPESLAALPFLLPADPPSGNEKLNIIPRDLIAAVLADKKIR